MDWKDIGKKLLSIGAPVLGTALAGPAGGLAAKAAVSAISKKFGLSENKVTPDTIDSLLGSPEHQIRFRELEIEEKVELQRLLNEETGMYLGDVQSARQMHIDTTKATGERDTNLYILAYAFVIGFFASIIIMMWLVLTNKLPESMPQYVVFLLGSLFGTLTAGVTAIIQFFFGSSKSSKDKTNLLVNR